MPFIHVSFNDKRIATYELGDGEISIGRTPNNSIVIDNPGVSSAQAKIIKEGDDYYIEDLGSKNGTYLKGERVSRHQLDFGDVITIFKHQLHYVPIVGDDAPVAEMSTNGGLNSQATTLEIDMSQHADLIQDDGTEQHVELVVFSEDGRSRTYRLKQQSYSIGKGDECLIRTSGLMAPSVSARLMRQASGYLLVPERSNEVRVNGVAIEDPCRLKKGDDIEIRKLRILYKVEKVDED